MENLTYSDPVTVREWIITLILTALPVIGIVMLFVWAFSAGTHPSKANFAKAALILTAVLVLVYVILGLFFGTFLLVSNGGSEW